ncbi:MAG: hypothetical protein EOO60_01585 [Hymenobacter sp.]|nr:MAG: hypothetical protein EOO60_01585 [Hymenobacter sp.]
MLLRIAFALFVFYALYTFIIEPQLSFFLKRGWKKLANKYACNQSVSLLSAPKILTRVGWNQFLLAIDCQSEGVYLQRETTASATLSATLLIPYPRFRRVSRPVAARLFAADQYDFFSVDGVALWVDKKYGHYILAQYPS